MNTVTVNPDGGGDYSTMTLAETARALGQADDWTINTASSGTTDTSSPVIAASRNGYSLTINDDGTYILEAASTYAFPFSISVDGVKVNDLIVNTDYRAAFNITGADNILDGCWAEYTGSSGGASTWGYFLDADGIVVANSVAVGMVSDGLIGNASTCYAYNNTLVGCGGAGIAQVDYRWLYCTNNYCGGNTGDDYLPATNNPERLVLTTCASEDSTGTAGLQSIAYSVSAGAYFTNVTAGSEDLHIGASSSLIGVWTDLRSDAVYPVTVDKDDVARAATDDVGAYKYVSAGGVSMSAQYYRRLM